MPASRDGTTDTSPGPSVSSDSFSPEMGKNNSSAAPTSTNNVSAPTATFAQTASMFRGQALLDNKNKKLIKKYRTEISASSASLASTLVAYPLDSVKTRMQAYKFPTFIDCVRHTYRTEGVHGFWRGVFAPLASITLVRTVSFSIYQKAKYNYDAWIHQATGKSPLVHANTRGAWPSLGTITCFAAAGATSGALITVISCPFELTKLNAQIAVLMREKGVNASTPDKGASGNKPSKTMGTVKTVKTIVAHRGLMGLYSGFHLHLLRDTIGTAIYFMTYESSKQMLANARGNSPTSPLAVVLAGGLCGLVSWACIYPIDSAKSIYQRNVLSASNAAPAGAERGSAPKGAKIAFFSRKRYRGLGVSMGRSCLVNAIFFSVFEGIKKGINKIELDDED